MGRRNDDDDRHGDASDADFAHEVGPVQPLKSSRRTDSRPPPPRPIPAQRQRDDREVMETLLHPDSDDWSFETGDELLWLRRGARPNVLTRLRRGRYAIQDSIDLHQMNETTARDVLLRFIAEAERRGLGCVRVVHGKGLRSRGRPKLRPMTGHVLRRHPAVLAFAPCRPIDGGTGATQVLLRRRR